MNIILLISDTYRYDNIYGNDVMPVRTPRLEEFAERAVGLSRYYTGSFPTIPQRTDLTTGRYGFPWHGWQDLFIPAPQGQRNHLPTLLRQAGYRSQLLCDTPHLFNANFHRGFDGAHTLRGQEGDIFFTRYNYEVEPAMPREQTRWDKGRAAPLVDTHRWQHRHWRGEVDRFPPRTAALAVEWLEENYQADPFFLWVDFFDPHEPWDPPEYMVRRYDPDYDGPAMLHPNYGPADHYTPTELRNLRAHYCAEAELVDRWVGRVLEKIDDLGLFDSSIVMFTTDHGMCLGDHDRTGKSNINQADSRAWPLYPELSHIPFLISVPGVPGGRAVDTLAQPCDVLPTLLDLAGLDLSLPEALHGKSMARQVLGSNADAVRDCVVASSHFREIGPDFQGAAPMLYTASHAYCACGSERTAELYDLTKDPGCTRNIAADDPATLNAMAQRLEAWFREIDAPQEMIEHSVQPR